jgi:hypothetical protein
MNERKAIQKAFRDNPTMAAQLRELHAAGKLQSTADVPDAEPLTIVAGPWPCSISGSKQVRCAICNCFLSIAPSTQTVMAERSGATTIKCFACMQKPINPAKIC